MAEGERESGVRRKANNRIINDIYITGDFTPARVKRPRPKPKQTRIDMEGGNRSMPASGATRKKRAVGHDLAQMQQLTIFLNALNDSIDPFTVSEAQFCLGDLESVTEGRISAKECYQLTHQFILRPFSASRNKTWYDNRFLFECGTDKSGEDSLMEERFGVYRSRINKAVSKCQFGRMFTFL
jgi:hypothetical protein